MFMLFDQEYATEQYGKAQKEEGIKEGWDKGRDDTISESIQNLMKNLKCTAEQARSYLGLAQEAPVMKEEGCNHEEFHQTEGTSSN